MKINDGIDQFITFLKVEKRYSSHTLKAYASDLDQLQDFLETSYDLRRVELCTSQHLRSFLVHMLDNQLVAKSINRKVSTIRRFFGFLVKKEILTDDITEKLIPPKIPKRLPEFIKESETQHIRDLVVSDDFVSMRDHTIVQVFYHTGMRRAELIGLRLFDIDFAGKRIKVMGKGGKERYVPISGDLSQLLKKYMAVRSEAFPELQDGHLFLTAKGKRAYPKLIYNIVRRQLTLLTTTAKKSPHILRHSFASHLLNNGADLNAIKEILGHANLSATQVYTHNSITKLKEAYRNAHPKSRS